MIEIGIETMTVVTTTGTTAGTFVIATTAGFITNTTSAGLIAPTGAGTVPFGSTGMAAAGVVKVGVVKD